MTDALDPEALEGQKLCECGCGQATRIPKWNDRRRGFKKGVPLRFVSGHNPRLSGSDHPGWKGGEHFDKTHGRWFVSRGGKQIPRARVVMADHLGRELRTDEHVHHINRDTADDRLENLQLLPESEHKRLHALERAAAQRAAQKYEWSKNHPNCVRCGTSQREHVAHGLCASCYQMDWRKRKALAA